MPCSRPLCDTTTWSPTASILLYPLCSICSDLRSVHMYRGWSVSTVYSPVAISTTVPVPLGTRHVRPRLAGRRCLRRRAVGGSRRRADTLVERRAHDLLGVSPFGLAFRHHASPAFRCQDRRSHPGRSGTHRPSAAGVPCSICLPSSGCFTFAGPAPRLAPGLLVHPPLNCFFLMSSQLWFFHPVKKCKGHEADTVAFEDRNGASWPVRLTPGQAGGAKRP